MTRILTAAAIIDASGQSRGPSAITFDGDRITSVEALPAGASFDDVLVMPALANAHDHGRQVRTSSIGGFGKPLEIWLHRLQLFGPVDPYLAAAAPFGRAVLGGQGASMVHYTRAQGLTDYVSEAKVVARAAKRCRPEDRLRHRHARRQSAGLWRKPADPRGPVGCGSPPKSKAGSSARL